MATRNTNSIQNSHSLRLTSQASNKKLLSLPYQDHQDRLLQLWFDPCQGLVVSVAHGDVVDFFGPERIFNAFNPQENGRQILARLSSLIAFPKHLALILRNDKVYILPLLDGAAGPDDARHLTQKDFYTTGESGNYTKNNYRAGLIKFSDTADKGFNYEGHDAHHSFMKRYVNWARDNYSVNLHHPALLGWMLRSDHVSIYKGHKAACEAFMVIGGTPEQFRQFLIEQAVKYQYQIGSYPGAHDPIGVSNSSTRGGLTQQAIQTAQNSRQQAFQEQLSATGLIKTYNSTNPEHPIISLGTATGKIGGVGLKTGKITGLKDTLFDLLEDEHTFLLPGLAEQSPFTNAELQQILRELATNIYVHGKRPLFSLHFNQDGSLYPIIPPEYADTLVGRVMGMLDYMMKGFLNGGVFSEDFVDAWARDGANKVDATPECLVDLQAYCRDHLGASDHYAPLQEIMVAMAVPEPHADRMRYRSSFRIIADNPIVRSGASFQIGTDFRVEYTIEATPEFEGYLRRHRAEHGCDPDDYIRLNAAYVAMAEQIRTTMPKLPMCRHYFNMLGVIHFFTHYFATLKDMHKVVVLQPRQPSDIRTFPRLMPPLPLRKTQIETIEVSLDQVVEHLTADDKNTLDTLVQNMTAGERLDNAVGADGAVNSSMITEQQINPILSQRLHIATLACAQEQIHNGQLVAAASEHSLIACQRTAHTWVSELAGKIANLRTQLLPHEATLASQRSAGVENLNNFRQYVARQEGRNRNHFAESRAVLDRNRVTALASALTENERQGRRLVAQASGWFSGPSDETLESINREIGESLKTRHACIDQKVTDDLNQIQAEEANEKQKLASEVARHGVQMNAYERSIDEAQESQNPIRAFIDSPTSCSDSLSFCKASLTLATSRLTNTDPYAPAEEGSSRYKLVGGCGLHVSNEAATPLPASETVAQHLAPALHGVEFETLRSIAVDGQTFWAFKLPVVDFIVAEDKDYSWLQAATAAAEGKEPSLPHTHLSLAVMQGKPELVERVLAAYPAEEIKKALNHADEHGLRLLHLAVQPGKAEVMRALLTAGADPLAADQIGHTALHLAAQSGDCTLVETLLAHSLRRTLVAAKARNGATPLHAAVQHGQTDVVTQLIAANVALTGRLTHGMTPLLSAAQHGYEDIGISLLNANAAPACRLDDGSQAIHLAAQSGQVRLLDCLLTKGALPQAPRGDGMTPLHLACAANELAACRCLLATQSAPEGQRVAIDAALESGLTPLHLAARHGHTALIDALLAAGARSDLLAWNNETALMVAIRHGQLGAALALRATSPWTVANAQGETAADLAAQYGLFPLLDAAFVAFRQSAGQAFALFDEERATENSVQPTRPNLAHRLCHIGQSDRLLAYLEAGWLSEESLAAQDMRGRLPWDLAIAGGHEAIMALFEYRDWPKTAWTVDSTRAQAAAAHGLLSTLLEELDTSGGIDPPFTADGRPVPGTRRLAYLAARNGNTACLAALARRNCAMVYSSEGQIYHVLQAAIEARAPDCVEIVLAHIDRLPTAFVNGLAPLQFAAAQGDWATYQILRRGGADVSAAAGMAVLDAAVAADRVSLVENLLSTVPAPPISVANVATVVRNGREQMLVALLAHGAPVDGHFDRSDDTPLLLAARRGDVGLIRLLLAAGAALNPTGHSQDALTIAAEAGHESLLLELLGTPGAETLLADSARVEKLFKCTYDRHMVHAVARLLALGATPIELGANPQMCPPAMRSLASLLRNDPGPQLEAERQLRAALHDNDIDALTAALKHWPPSQQLTLLGDHNGTRLRPIGHILAARPSVAATAYFDEHGEAALLARDEEGNTALHVAAISGNITLLFRSLDVTNLAGETPLMQACRAHQPAVVQHLLLLGAEVDRTNKRGRGALHLTAEQDDVQSMVLLINANARGGVDAQDHAGLTPLMLAQYHSNLGATLALLAAGADVHLKEHQEGFSALHLAASYGDAEIVMLLLANGAQVSCLDTDGDTPLHMAATRDNPAVVAALLGQQSYQIAARNKSGIAPLDQAASYGHLSVIKLLTEANGPGLDEVADGTMSPLLWAASAGQAEPLRYLWQQGARIDQVDAAGRDALEYAAGHGAIEVAQFIEPFYFAKEAGSRIRALAAAAQSNSIVLVARLLDQGLGVDLLLRPNETALTIACRVGSTGVTKLLLDRGANPRAAAAHAAVVGNHLADLKLLLEVQPALIQAQTDDGGGLLHLAAAHGSTAVATLLLSFGCKVDLHNKTDQLPIDVALAAEQLELVGILLGFGSPLPGPTPNVVAPTTTTEIAARAAALGERYRAARQPDGGIQPSRLHVAAALGNEIAITALSKLDDLEARDSHGRTPLFLAANPAVVRRLIRADIDLNALDAMGATALHHFVRQGQYVEAGLVLDCGAKPDTVTPVGRTALLEAFERDNLPLFRRILAKCRTAAQPKNLPAHEAWRAAIASGDIAATVCWASQVGRAQVAALARKNGAVAWRDVMRSPDLLRLMVRYLDIPTKDLGAGQSSALHLAAEWGLTSAVEWLMQADPALSLVVDQRRMLALCRAFRTGNIRLGCRMAELTIWPASGPASLTQQVDAALSSRDFCVWQHLLVTLDTLSLPGDLPERMLLRASRVGRDGWNADLLLAVQAHPGIRRAERGKTLAAALQAASRANQGTRKNPLSATRQARHAPLDPGYVAWLAAQVRQLTAAEALPEVIVRRRQEATIQAAIALPTTGRARRTIDNDPQHRTVRPRGDVA